MADSRLRDEIDEVALQSALERMKLWVGGAPLAYREVELLRPDAKHLLAALAAKDAEIARLREFAEKVLNAECWGRVLDGGDLQDRAEKLGLIVEVPADDEFRDEYDADTMYVCAWSDAARRKPQ